MHSEVVSINSIITVPWNQCYNIEFYEWNEVCGHQIYFTTNKTVKLSTTTTKTINVIDDYGVKEVINQITITGVDCN